MSLSWIAGIAKILIGVGARRIFEISNFIGMRLQIDIWIVPGESDRQTLTVLEQTKTLDEMRCFTPKAAAGNVASAEFVESDGIYHQGVTFPMADRMTVGRRLVCGRIGMPAPIEIDVPRGGGLLRHDENLILALDNIDRWRLSHDERHSQILAVAACEADNVAGLLAGLGFLIEFFHFWRYLGGRNSFADPAKTARTGLVSTFPKPDRSGTPPGSEATSGLAFDNLSCGRGGPGRRVPLKGTEIASNRAVTSRQTEPNRVPLRGRDSPQGLQYNSVLKQNSRRAPQVSILFHDLPGAVVVIPTTLRRAFLSERSG